MMMTKPAQQPQQNTPQQDNKDPNQQNDISSRKVIDNIGKINNNLTKLLKTKKFRDAYTLDYQPIQKVVGKQMQKIGDEEQKSQKYLSKTEDGIVKLKKQKGSLFGMLFGGMGALLVPVLGALILITLARIGLKKWKKTYMPDAKDGNNMTILGVKIPNWEQIKAFGTGLYNFFRFGLLNYVDRMKSFFNKIYKSLFGKKGAFKNMIETRNTLRKVGLAFLIGLGKKHLGGAIVWILTKVLDWVAPGSGTIAHFLIKLVPALLTFISTQLMLAWSNKTASAEQQAKQAESAQLAYSRQMIGQMKKNVLSMAYEVKPFKNQSFLIPDLQTGKGSRGGGGGKPIKGAIMRNMHVRNIKSFKVNKKLQEQQAEEQGDAVSEQQYNRWKKSAKNKNDLVARMKNDMIAFQQDVNKYAKENDRWYTAESIIRADYAAAHLKEAFKTSLIPEIAKLNAYIKQLSSSTRFKNVKGPLYDPIKGWNPGYRVLSSDLLSVIPLEPFTSISGKRNIPIGQPAPAETDSIGFMPFKWVDSHGHVNVVHPILYELQRAKAIRQIYNNMIISSIDTGWFSDNSKADLEKPFKDNAKYWNEWNFPQASHEVEDYPNRTAVVYEDFFTRFLKRFRNNEISDSRNNLQTALGQRTDDSWGNLGMSGDTIDNMATGYLNAVTVDWGASQRPLDEAFHYTRKGALKIRRGVDDIKEVLERQEKLGAARIKEWKKQEFNGISYGKVRDLMLGGGIVASFNRKQIKNTTLTAIPILEQLIKMNVLSKAPSPEGGGKRTAMHDLMWTYFNWTGDVKDYNWKNAATNLPSQAGFAQSFLEYLIFNVMPQWNVVEQLLMDDVTYQTDDTAKKLAKAILNLHAKFDKGSILKFLDEHLRFPNMKVKLLTLSNARGNDRDKILKYMKDLGILNPKEKNKELQTWQTMWPNLSSLTDKELHANMKTMMERMKSAQIEVKATGDLTYMNQLKKFYQGFAKELEARERKKNEKGKIVDKPGKISTVVEPPPKTLEEIEQQKKKDLIEQQKREAEAKRKQQEEREKKLKEEAERKQQLAIAEAKIKAMEAIKKQELAYENLLQKMVSTPEKVTESELNAIGKEVKNLKQEAENRISQLPREERELKLALIRGDKLSPKTFEEVKTTAIGLHGSLQGYIEEVNKIPVGNVMAI